MAMKGCELCDRPARMYCESDQASLCWECDARVHGANFLVARHDRVLLCRRCQAPTPWRASGARLGPTFSVCDRCAGVGKISERDEGEGEEEREDVIEEDDSDDDSEDEDEDEDEEANGEEEEEEEDGDNQVVPWTLPPPASSSTSEDSSSKLCNGAPKRMRENTADPDCHQDNRTCSTSQPSYFAAAAAEDEATSFGGSFHPSKDRRRFGAGAGAGNGAPSSGALHIRNRRNIRSIDFVSSGSGSPPM